VLAAAHGGLTHGAVAARFQVGESTVRGWLRRERLSGRRAPLPHAGGAGPKVAGAAEQTLRDLVAERDERTLAELADALRERTGAAVGIMSVWRACKRLGLTRKKKEPGARRAGAA
jgi:transposase